ncbi:MAG: sodium:proton antiporter, partial [Lachnospiraceae bacterium]|nr:sodium:proton antiporter [Lachnospiraceae bacterium]
MAIFSIMIFCIALVICLVCKVNVVVAIIFGFFDFVAYALYKKYPIKKVWKMCVGGCLTCKNVFITFSLIAMLTALWRCSGTIPAIIYYLLKLVNYKYFLVFTFLFCSALSIMLGSLIATATTMGVICMTIARSLGLNEVMIMGAILSGVIVGDRMSPVSTSCLLVSDLTGTDMYDNIKYMFITSIIPFTLTALVYFILGTRQVVDVSLSLKVVDALYDNYHINIISIIPMLSIIILSLFRVNIKINVIISMVLSILVGFINEKASITTMLYALIMGYKSTNPDVSSIIYGGGFVSVINVLILVGFSAAFS